jgi:hypothetical protein
VWGDPDVTLKRQLDARVQALSRLSPDDQRQIDDWGRRGRELQRQAQVEAGRNKNETEAGRLRAEANDLFDKGRALRQQHADRVALEIRAAQEEFRLVNIRAGEAAHAIAFKTDRTFPDYTDPNRIQLIVVSFAFKADTRTTTPRGTWKQKTKETFDFAALAALLR